MPLSTESSLEQWLAYIESIHPTEIELGLQRLKIVAERLLQNQSHKPLVFTVAGTNGKGTTTAALSALACEAGLKTGWYSSPHLFTFNERVRVNGVNVLDQQLVNAFDAIESIRGDISLSYFEYTTLAAFWIFIAEQVDVWVLEVGLGGRLDAVNVIDADIAVITTIGIDHEAYLGSDIDIIGYEKAGICRAGRPVVLGSRELPEGLYKEVAARNATPYPLLAKHGVRDGQLFWQQGKISAANIHIPLDNAATALQAFSLSGIELTESAAQGALESIRMPGRMQKVDYKGHSVIVDVGHNPHAAAYIAAQLNGQQINVLIGMLSDKDAEGFVAALAPIAKQISCVSLDVPRGLSAHDLAKRTKHPISAHFDSMTKAIDALTRSMPDIPLFIGGSFYTVCDALAVLEK
jgi:dihydrofolate synthase/folylpolyglutamate synthase